MELKTRAIVAFGVGAFLSMPASALMFNLVPGVAMPLSTLVCDERLRVLPSSRNHSHTYLCGDADITVRASIVVWVALVLLLAAIVFTFLPRKGGSTK